MVKKIHIISKIKSIFEIFRVDQYVKSLLVFAPLLIIAKDNFFSYFYNILPVFFCFILLSSIIYIINDINDLESDKLNPFKFNRPLVKGTISIKECLFLISLLILIFIFIFFNFSLFKLSYVFLSYFLINLFYCFVLKKFFLIDILSVSSGYGLRVISGYITINTELNIALISGVILLSMFILMIKRRAEYNEKTFKNSLNLYDNQKIYKNIILIINLLIITNYYFFAKNLFDLKLLIISYIFVFFALLRLNLLIIEDKVKKNITNFIIKDIYLIILLFIWIVIFILRNI